MLLSELISTLLAQTPITVRLKDDREVDQPSDLMDIALHHAIADAIFDACKDVGFSPRQAAAFSEWLAELCTGFATRLECATVRLF